MTLLNQLSAAAQDDSDRICRQKESDAILRRGLKMNDTAVLFSLGKFAT